MSAKKRVKRSTKAKAPKRAKRAKAKARAPRKTTRVNKRAPKRLKTKRSRTPVRARTLSKKARAKTTRTPAKKKPAAKKSVQAKPRAAAPISRRDGGGHLNPRYKAELRALSREGHTKDDNRAFFNTAHSRDDLAEELGEQAVETMNSGEDEGEDLLNQTVPEESGGPFVESSGSKEFADGTDGSNPEGATREPFPTT